MADLLISNELAQQLSDIAKQESRPLESLLTSMLNEYKQHHRQSTSEDTTNAPDQRAYEAALQVVRPKLYELARRYWQEIGDTEHLALTDEQLDEQFWLIDSEGIPRLKSEQAHITIPDNSLYNLGQTAQRIAFKSGQPDIAEHSRDILRKEYGDYLQRRLKRPDDATR